MTFKNALMLSLLSVVSLSALLIGAVGYRTISDSVIREAQERVNHDLRISHHFYTRQLDELAQTTAQACNCLVLKDPELGPRLARIRQDLGLDVLNLVDDRGAPVAGAFGDEPQPVALGLDPVHGEHSPGRLHGDLHRPARRLLHRVRPQRRSRQPAGEHQGRRDQLAHARVPLSAQSAGHPPLTERDAHE